MKNLSRILSVLIILCAVSVITVSAQITDISQVKDVQPTDKHYLALQSLVERYGVFSDKTFRGNDPLTREEFVVLLNKSLDTLIELAASTDEDIAAYELFNNFSANQTNITSTSQIKDIKASYDQYIHLQSLTERYGIDICDADKNFRPTKTVTEKEFYTWIAEIFNGSANSNPSATKAITRSEWIMVMEAALDSVNERIARIVKEKAGQKTIATPNNSTPPVASKSKDLEKLLKEAETFEKAGDFANALINYREAGNAAWDAPTEMKCGIATYRIAKRLIERDSGDDPISKSRRESYKKYLTDAVDFLSSALLSDKKLVEAYQTRAAAYRLLGKTKEAETDEQKVKELGGTTSQIPTRSKLEIIQSLASKGKARITGKGSFYLPDNPCADLSNAGPDLKIAVEKGGIWGTYKMDKGDIGDIIFETNNTCTKGKLVLLRVGTAIVTIGEKDIKRLK